METLTSKGASSRRAHLLNGGVLLCVSFGRYKMTIGFQNFRNFMEACDDACVQNY